MRHRRRLSAAYHTRSVALAHGFPLPPSPNPRPNMAGDMDFAASLLNPEGGSTPGAESGEQTPISPEQTPTDSGAQTPLQPDEPPPNVGAGGAEGGGGGGGTKQLCRI
eukprot:scaffold36301_cov57-Phaeocystis_antarctica.AAC.2